jgi:hypothetical protein
VCASRGVSNGWCSHRPFVIIRNPSRFTKGAMKVNFGEDDVTEFTFRTRVVRPVVRTPRVSQSPILLRTAVSSGTVVGFYRAEAHL